MSAVDQAIESGVRALSALWSDEEEYGPHEGMSLAVARAHWPALSTGLRELHSAQWECGNPRHTNPDMGCPECCGVCVACDRAMPCATVQELDRIDRELGIGPERAAPCADHRPVQHRDARPPRTWTGWETTTMSDLTTHDVREMFISGAWESGRNGCVDDMNAAEFDRWLAAHDAKVKAEALLDFARVVESIAALGARNTGLRTPEHLAEFARNYVARAREGIEQ